MNTDTSTDYYRCSGRECRDLLIHGRNDRVAHTLVQHGGRDLTRRAEPPATEPTSITAYAADRDRLGTADAWWHIATAAGFPARDNVDTTTYDYDQHLTIDSVRVDGDSLDELDDAVRDAGIADYCCVEVFGHVGRFYVLVINHHGAIGCHILELNDACPNCGGEADLDALAGCTAHVSSESDDEDAQPAVTCGTVLTADNGAAVSVRIENTPDGPIVRVIGENCDLWPCEPGVIRLTNVTNANATP